MERPVWGAGGWDRVGRDGGLEAAAVEIIPEAHFLSTTILRGSLPGFLAAGGQKPAGAAWLVAWPG